jgi:hypothetical protein
MRAVGIKTLKNRLSEFPRLAALDYLRGLDPKVELATYDQQMARAGRALGVGSVELEPEADEGG